MILFQKEVKLRINNMAKKSTKAAYARKKARESGISSSSSSSSSKSSLPSSSGRTITLSDGRVLTGDAAANYGKSSSVSPTSSGLSLSDREAVIKAGMAGGLSREQATAIANGGSVAPFQDAATEEPGVYDMLIAQDPLLAEYFKNPKDKADFDKLPDELKGAYLQMARSASKAIESGKVINPDLVKVTSSQLAEFYTQAEKELDPYYKEQFDLMKGDLERSVGRITEDYNRDVQRSEEPFKQGLQEQSQLESEQGNVYSSERNRREAASILGQNQALGDLATGAQRNVQDLGIGFEQSAGSDLARSLNLPSIKSYGASNQGYTPQGVRSLYVPLGGVTGSGQRERTTALKTRQNELEQKYRQSRVLDLAPLSY